MPSIKELKQYLETLQNLGIKELYAEAGATPGSTAREEDYSNLDNESHLALLEAKYANCTKCALSAGRIKFVYGDGNPEAKVMIIGEAPGEQENLMGKPFVGKAGELLDRMIAAIHLDRETVYIANIVKCRPPGNRDPQPEERIACLPYLVEQISIVKPKIILMMGLVAAQTLLATNQSLGNLRQKVHFFEGIPSYVSYHPAALLRNPNWKAPAWEDLKLFYQHYLNLI